jgi:amidase
MNRRNFLRAAGLGGAAIVANPAFAAVETMPVAKQSPERVKSFELDEATIPQLQKAMAAGQFSAVSLAKKYLARIEEIDHRGPALNSVIELNPDALAIAAALDKERKAKGPRGPLHGVPVLIKDNIDTHDRMTTTAGSLALEGSIAPQDSTVAQKLRDAGAVILGKTNLSEWANFRGSPSTSGWSGRGGQTRNPYAVDRNPSGSSSGSGVAVSANLCAVAVGTETDGSILSPSSYNGIVGLKPTVGLVSRAGIIPISASQDTAGPMARTVTDAAILLGALSGPDPRDPSSAQSAFKLQADYARFLDPNGLRGARLGVARKLFTRFNTKANTLMESLFAELKKLGAEVIDPIDLSVAGDIGKSEPEVMLYEFKAGLNAYLAGLGSQVQRRTLKDLIDFNERHRDKELPWFGQQQFEKAEAKGPLTEQAYLDAVATCRRLSRVEGIDKTMEEHQLDAIIAPTAGPAHVTDLFYGDRGTGGTTTLAAVAGYPSITVPAGQVSGLPVGLSFFGTAWSEPKLLKIAYAFEQATKARARPRFLPTLSV